MFSVALRKNPYPMRHESNTV
jgi:hypothetical protein